MLTLEPPQRMALAAAGISDERNHLTEASARLSQPTQQKLSRVAMKGSNIDYIVVVQVMNRSLSKRIGRLGLGCTCGGHER